MRRFSAYGPCLVQGELLRDTAKFYVAVDMAIGAPVDTSAMSPELLKDLTHRYAKDRHHVEPCRSCRDHAQTHYPNGYQD